MEQKLWDQMPRRVDEMTCSKVLPLMGLHVHCWVWLRVSEPQVRHLRGLSWPLLSGIVGKGANRKVRVWRVKACAALERAA